MYTVNLVCGGGVVGGLAGWGRGKRRGFVVGVVVESWDVRFCFCLSGFFWLLLLLLRVGESCF
jgi:hypothetical protein